MMTQSLSVGVPGI